MNLHKYPEIMTLEEVSEYLRCTERTVANWAADGKIPAGKIGMSWRFKRSDIQKWVNSQIRGKKADSSGVNFAELFSRERVMISDLSSKNEVLELLIETMDATPFVKDPNALREAIYRRERLMSTGIGMQLGVPHVRLESITDIAAACVLTEKPLDDYETIDGSSVRLVVMIVAREDQHTEHLKTLSYLGRMMKNPETHKKLLDCKDADELYAALTS